jgi:YVTN family beta-propeller protein
VKVWAQSTVITINVGESPQNMKYNPSNGNIYVSNSNSGDISVIDSDTNKVIHTIDAGESPQNMKYNPSNGNIYVTNKNSDNVSLITITETNSTS